MIIIQDISEVFIHILIFIIQQVISVLKLLFFLYFKIISTYLYLKISIKSFQNTIDNIIILPLNFIIGQLSTLILKVTE